MKRKLFVRSVSETGLVRKDNQDSIFVSADNTVFCVADGMGGGSDGALAGRIVCEEVESASAAISSGLREAVDRAIENANRRVRDHAIRQGFRQMGSTALVLVFDPEDDTRVSICHVGDSRVYRIRDSRVELMTSDHTIGNQLVRLANAETAKKLRSRANPLSHILTRAIGSKDPVEPEWRDVDVRAGDWFLACSDGVHDVLDEERIQEIFAGEKTLDGFSDRLRTEVLGAGAPDNFSYIVIKTAEDA